MAALVAVTVALAARPTPGRLLFGLLAFALTVPAVLLDGTWVIALDLAAAWALAKALRTV